MAKVPMMVALNKGLNSVVPPVLAEAGTLLSALNYEVVPQVGYKKIDGYEMYDGFQSGAVERAYRVTVADTSSFVQGNLLLTEDNILIGIVTGVIDTTHFDFVPIGTNEELSDFATLSGISVSDVTDLSDLEELTAAQQTALLREYSSYLRDAVGLAAGTVAGLHWFDDRLYAVVSNPSDPTIATLYVAVNEFISQEESIPRGWNEVEAGSFVEFEEGYSPYGRLIHYSKAYSDIESATSPTSVLEDDGAAIKLVQSIKIDESATSEVNGWKPSSAPTTYDVTPEDIENEDTEYVYADAVWSWDTGITSVNARNGYRSTALVQNDPNYRLGGLVINTESTSREFSASNAYTTLLLKGIKALGENLPKTAIITGIELIVDYDADVLMYGKNITDDVTAVEDAAFDTINSMNLKATLLKENDSREYEILGTSLRTPLETEKTSFTETEEGTKDSSEEWHVYSITDQTATIGDGLSMFGNTELSYADLVSGFGIGLSVDPSFNPKPSYASSGTAAYRLKIDKVRIKVYFALKSSFYYVLGDFVTVNEEEVPTTVFKVNLTSSTVDYGNFETGDARGLAHFTSPESVLGTRTTILPGDEIHSQYPATGTASMKVISQTDAYLPGHALLKEYDSQYQFISANFYGDRNWNTMYGVSGAGRAFFYDNNTLGFIMTQYDEDKDRPRHVAEHLNHLVLGFDSGSAQISVVGEPTNFNGIDGASEWAMGDKITGLLPLTGSTLGVFCSKSIQSISGSSVQNFSHQTVVPNQGVIEYTVRDAGQPLFATTSGISTLEQTAAYGDFAGSRISDQVSTWLPRRLLSTQRSGSAIGVAGSMVVRAKNQYRLFFKDGLVVSLTLDGQINPIMTSRYTFEDQALIPLAFCSELDHTGSERLFVSATDIAEGYVFELDKGWGFNGTWFPHYFELSHIFPDNGTLFGKVEKVRLHGQSKGLATLNLKASGIERNYKQDYHDTEQDISMPINPDSVINSFYPATSIVDHANWGLGIKLKIQGTQPADLTLTEPSHICQALIVYMNTEGANDG